MTSLVPPLGTRIHRLRLRQHRTLESVARECGFTKSLLSKIERGKTTPPVATLMKIARALGTEVGDLLSEHTTSSTVFTPAADLAEANLTRTDKGYFFHLFAGRRADKLMQPFLFVARKGEITRGALAHRGEEFIYVLAGEMTFSVDHVDYRMRPGDSLYFDSNQPHDLNPLTPSVTYLAVFADAGEVRRPAAPRKPARAAGRG